VLLFVVNGIPVDALASGKVLQRKHSLLVAGFVEQLFVVRSLKAIPPLVGFTVCGTPISRI